MRTLFLFFTLNVLYQPFGWAQMLSNQGAVVSVKGGFVSVKGGVYNAHNGTFDNSTQIYVTGDWENHVAQPFTSTPNGQGKVRLLGDAQTIQGSMVTNFYDLHLENTNIKYATLDVAIYNQLFLNDREFSVATNTAIVYNTALNAVQTGLAGVFGFVSSSQTGGLQRFTNQTQAYFYPVGSSAGIARFRPVELTPSLAQASSYKTGFINHDATNDGFDRALRAFTVCDVNDLYYHRIQNIQTSTSPIPATTRIYYDAAADDTFTDIGQWTGVLWDEASLATTATSSPYNLQSATSNQAIAYSTLTMQPTAFISVSPPIDLAIANNPLCANVPLELTANGSYSSFDFYIDTFLVQSSASNVYTALQTPRTVPVWVSGSNGQCGRYSDTTLVTIYPAVNGQASNDTIIVTGTSANLVASGGDFYSWTPANFLTCASCDATVATPTETTTFYVEIENIDGCTDMDTVVVTVKENVENIVFIPNVLTPNNDGKNDTWFIRNIHLFPRNKVKILNRWGDVVHQSDFYQNDWDGHYSGGLLPAGTYYYILDLGDQWGIFKGDVTIIR